MAATVIRPILSRCCGGHSVSLQWVRVRRLINGPGGHCWLVVCCWGARRFCGAVVQRGGDHWHCWGFTSGYPCWRLGGARPSGRFLTNDIWLPPCQGFVCWWGRWRIGLGRVLGGVAHRLKPVPARQNALKRIGDGGGAARGQVSGLVVVALLGLLIGGELFALQRYYVEPAYSKTRGWRDLATTLTTWSAALPTEQVRIAQNFPDPTLWYYYQGTVDHVVLPPGAQDEAGAQATVNALVDAGVEWILLPRQPAPNWDNREIAVQALTTAYDLALATQVGVWPVSLYSRPPQSLTPLAVTFQNGLALVGFAVQGQTLMPGGALVVYLAWQPATATLTGSEKVFVHLLDAQGQLVAQNDQPLTFSAAPNTGSVTGPATGPSTTIYGILLPEKLASGPYRLIAGLYDPALPGAPRLLTATGTDFITVTEWE